MFRPTLACRTRCPVLLLAPLLGLPYLANAEETPTTLPEMTVEGEASAGPLLYQVDLEQAPVTTPDTAALLRRAPGANVNRNGPLTGIAQYRGMYGDRVNVMVNGIRINTGGPNGMDPALSYIPRNQLQSLEVIRGIAPVSSGAETIGGTIIANGRTGEFGSSERMTPSIDFTGGGATVNDSGNGSVLGSFASLNHRLHVNGSRERGGNIEFGDGKIRPTRHERNNFGGGYGFRTGAHEFSLDISRNETDPTGTPALPMDIIDINTSIFQGGYSGDMGGYAINAKAFWTDVNHHMSNYELRDPPVMMNGSRMTRLNDATSSGLGYRLDVALPLASGTLTLGADGHQDEHDSTITDPVNQGNNFRIENFNEVERDVYGFFAEWNGPVATDWNLQLGGRYNRVNNDADEVSARGIPMPPMAAQAAILQDRFNDADRDKSDNNFDFVAKLSHALNTSTTVSIEAGHKTRSPSYQERYLWLPLEATNGLADGNVYVGDINLDPEKAYEVGLGLDWYGSKAYFEPRVFYRYVDDYIQGTPATDDTVTAIWSDALQFSNVDAKLYGADAAWGVTLTDHWSLDGIVSYVRGERDDISDDLYRIAPLNGRLSVTYRESDWWATLEGVAYAEQDDVSKTNNEQETDSYQLLNLRAGVELMRNLFINAGVENIFDNTARDHLTGINRVADSDVAVGDRLPSAGRNFFASLQYRYD